MLVNEAGLAADAAGPGVRTTARGLSRREVLVVVVVLLVVGLLVFTALSGLAASPMTGT